MKKTILSIFAAAIILCSLIFLSSCTVLPINTAQNVAEKTESVQIFCLDSKIKARLSEVSDYYLKDHKNVKLIFDCPKNSDGTLPQLTSSLAGDDQPVLFNIRGSSDLLEIKDCLYDLSKTKLAKRTEYNLLDNTSDSGKIYGLPTGLEATGVIYNKEIFTDFKINPDNITDIASLTAAVKRLNKQITAGKLSAKYPNLQNVFYPLCEENASHVVPMLLNSSARYKNESSLSSLSSIEIYNSDLIEKLVKLNAEYASLKNSELSCAYQMANGYTAVCIGSSRIISDIKSENYESADKFAFLGIPNGRLCIGTAYWAVNKNASPAKIGAALDFLEWLYDSDVGKTAMTNSLGLIFPYSGYESAAQSKSLTSSAANFILTGKTYADITSGLPPEMNKRYFSKLLGADSNKNFKKIVSKIKKDFATLQKSAK